jgi:dephospho-CoA kinase
VTLELLRECGFPLACTSANLSAQTSPHSFADAAGNFGGDIPGIDGGDCAVGVESTVLDLTRSPPKILRRGGLPTRALERVLGKKIDGATVIGITGGSGAGKSTALKALSSMGAEAIDCDEVYHELTMGDMDMLREVEARFPGTVMEHVLDRRALGDIVFRDESALADLNAITHKYVRREVVRRLQADAKIIAIELTATIQSGLVLLCDYVVCVTAPEELRVTRVMERNNIPRERAIARIRAQTPDEYFISRCDLVLNGDFATEKEFMAHCAEKLSAMLAQ